MYNSDSAIIKHVVQLLEKIARKYIGQDKDLFTFLEAKKILLNIAKQIDKNEEH